MKPEFDTEIDALLRRHAQRAMSPPEPLAPAYGAAENGQSLTRESHPDADELSAYAENALPAQTRARYASHLADCDQCRHIATNIALAANVAGELERRAEVIAPAETAAVSWRERMAAWFATGAWRYALPLVALLLVSGVVWLAILKQGKPAGEVAVRNSGPAKSAAPAQTEAHHAQDSAAAPPPAPAPAQPGESPAPVEQQETPPSAIVAAGPGGGPSREADEQSSAAGKAASAASRPIDSDIAADGGAIAPAATPPAAIPTPSVEGLEVVTRAPAVAPKTEKLQESARDDESSGRGAENTYRGGNKDAGQLNSDNVAQNRGYVRELNKEERPRSNDTTAAQSSNERRQKSRAGASVARSQREAAPAMSAAESKRKESESAAAEETRTLAGRRFRRQGGAWIDATYKSAQALVIVRRGSEQFRALVADAPELRSIANAFSGEVIVVWQGRAYRIR